MWKSHSNHKIIFLSYLQKLRIKNISTTQILFLTVIFFKAICVDNYYKRKFYLLFQFLKVFDLFEEILKIIIFYECSKNIIKLCFFVILIFNNLIFFNKIFQVFYQILLDSKNGFRRRAVQYSWFVIFIKLYKASRFFQKINFINRFLKVFSS